MSSYLISGVARGIGFEFMRQLSENPENTIFGLVRDKAAAGKKVEAELNRKNIHIIQADVTDYGALEKAVDYVSEATGGSLDYIIANAALIGKWSASDNFGTLAKEPVTLEQDLLDHFKVNVVSQIHLFNLFVPLILKGRVKKVIAISSGMGDVDFVAKQEVEPAGPYAISKAALNLAIAKFSAEYRKQGVLFISVSPGVVDTGNMEMESEEQGQKLMAMVAGFQAYAPNWTGPITPEASVKAVVSVIEKANVEAGDGGSFVSHFGNKQWI
ncbi:hypothetical protein BJ170DRAFT_625098 [Xylariales sp. AK1849]|nr:hypothetical protein BJ170DRAFT_625098 [Xylariales sp. AK1849]